MSFVRYLVCLINLVVLSSLSAQDVRDQSPRDNVRQQATPSAQEGKPRKRKKKRPVPLVPDQKRIDKEKAVPMKTTDTLPEPKSEPQKSGEKKSDDRKKTDVTKPEERQADAPRKQPPTAKSDTPRKPTEPPTEKPRSASAEAARLVAASLDQVDQDFAFQGEYMGVVAAPSLQTNRLGLQVVALGDGKFEANLLRGGLPGAGWDRRVKQTVTGQLSDNRLMLRNEQWAIAVDGRQAVVSGGPSPNGVVLEKYHRISATQDAPPPANAVVLFNGHESPLFTGAKLTPDGLLGVGGVTSFPVHDFQMHLEFRTPYMPYARGQSRGNSGVYIQQRYEVQILDSFGLEGVENECGGMYRQRRPAVNMCLPPLSWQTYDIYFAAARWGADGRKVAPARITLLHNGEAVHMNYELTDKTGGGKAESAEDLPILLQNHGNPVTFRNVWLVAPGASNRRHEVGRAAFPASELWLTAGPRPHHGPEMLDRQDGKNGSILDGLSWRALEWRRTAGGGGDRRSQAANTWMRRSM